MPQLTHPAESKSPQASVAVDVAVPVSPSSGGGVGYKPNRDLPMVPAIGSVGTPIPPASSPNLGETSNQVALELQDGAVYRGYSFGAQKSVAGELVFQTGMVGYPESITDPSYRGQILVITFPLVGNYGVPPRQPMDEILKVLPKYFESKEIHIAALVVASYSGEDYSHFLAQSSLGQWLEEQGVPAMYGVDTRSLTKRIRTEGSMLGRLLLQKTSISNGHSNGAANDIPNGKQENVSFTDSNWMEFFEQVDWVDPNAQNLVKEGELIIFIISLVGSTRDILILLSHFSVTKAAAALFATGISRSETSFRKANPRSLP